MKIFILAISRSVQNTYKKDFEIDSPPLKYSKIENFVINLIVENTKAGEVWGRINYEDDLLVKSAENVK